jgi:hypothetical protein
MIRSFFLSLLWLPMLCEGGSLSSYSQILHVGNGHPYPTLNDALTDVEPGDTVLVHEGTYAGGLYFENIQGTWDNRIFIQAAPGETVIFDGGNNAWQFTDAAYLNINGFIFEHQTGNGLNFDDGGSYETPAHHLIFANCTFRDMNASGNNDLFKLSGVDNFEIFNCVFLNGATGGSGIDMVGCHDGLISQCHFENLGSNSIQAKGGTRNIRIEANFFKNGGQRSLNLGGSTGLQFFRPIDAEYEAAELKVYSNVFVGSTAPVAFVGCINSEVINNTMYLPENWVLRILQETVGSRFFPCGNNTFRNNLIYIDNQVTVECNIGPNTDPESFTFSNNLWFHSEQSNWSGPDLPVVDADNIINADPLFENAALENFSLTENSPAIGQGFSSGQPALDFTRDAFNIPRSIGAFEGNLISDISNLEHVVDAFTVHPNPANESLLIQFHNDPHEALSVSLVSVDGAILKTAHVSAGTEVFTLPVREIVSGVYLITLSGKSSRESRVVIID